MYTYVNIMKTSKKFSLFLASALLVAAPSFASSITSFTFTPDPSIFTSVLVDSFSASEADITGTVTCAATAACSGEVGSFNLGLDLTSTTPLAAEISGILSGTTTAVGSLEITSPTSKIYAFSLGAGSFDSVILSTSFPAFGAINVKGTLDLALAAGQSIDLPLAIKVGNVSSVPEPSGQVLLIVGLLGLAGMVRYRRSRIV